MGNSLTGKYGLGVIFQAVNKVSPVLKKMLRDQKLFRKSQESNLIAMKAWAAKIGVEYSRMKKSMMSGMKFTMAGAAILTPLGLIARAAAKSEDSMNDMLSVLIANKPIEEAEKDLVRMREAIFTAAKDGRKDLSEVQAAGYKVLSAFGGDIEKAAGAIGVVTDLSIAGMGSVMDAADVATAALENYGKKWTWIKTEQEKALRVGNAVAATIQATNTTLPELSMGLKQALGPAASLGIEFADLVSSIGALQTKGLHGEMAGSAYTAFLRQISKLTDESGKEIVGASLEQMIETLGKGGGLELKSDLFAGMDLTDAEGKLLPTYKLIEQMEERLGMTPEHMEEIKKLAEKGIYGEEAMKKLSISATDYKKLIKAMGEEGSKFPLAFLGHSQELKGYYEAAQQETKLAEMKAVRMRSLIAQWHRMKNAINIVAIKLGDHLLPTIKAIIDVFSSIAKNMEAFFDKHPRWAKMIITLVTAFGVIITTIGILKIVLAGLRFLFVTSLGPIGLIIAGIGAALYLLITNFSAVKNFIVSIAKSIAGFFKGIYNWFDNLSAGAKILFVILLGPIGLLIGGLYIVIKHFKLIKTVVSSVIGFIVGLVKGAYNIFTGLPKGIKILLMLIFGPLTIIIGSIVLLIKYFDKIKNVIWSVLKFIGNIFAGIWGAINTDWLERAVGAIGDAFSRAANFVKGIWEAAIGWIEDKIQGLADMVSGVTDVITWPFRQIADLLGLDNKFTVSPVSVMSPAGMQGLPGGIGPSELSGMYHAQYGHLEKGKSQGGATHKTYQINFPHGGTINPSELYNYIKAREAEDAVIGVGGKM